MNTLKSILLILVVAASSCYNSLVWAFFESYQSYFATELCELKEDDQNSCQGTCQLRALLQAKEEPMEPKTPIFTEELDFITISLKGFTINNPHVLRKEPNPRLELDWLSDGVKRLVWRPPCQA